MHRNFAQDLHLLARSELFTTSDMQSALGEEVRNGAAKEMDTLVLHKPSGLGPREEIEPVQRQRDDQRAVGQILQDQRAVTVEGAAYRDGAVRHRGCAAYAPTVLIPSEKGLRYAGSTPAGDGGWPDGRDAGESSLAGFTGRFAQICTNGASRVLGLTERFTLAPESREMRCLRPDRWTHAEDLRETERPTLLAGRGLVQEAGPKACRSYRLPVELCQGRARPVYREEVARETGSWRSRSMPRRRRCKMS